MENRIYVSIPLDALIYQESHPTVLCRFQLWKEQF